MKKKKILVDVPGARTKFEEWFARGDFIGVFTNRDLGHHDLGRRVFVPLSDDEVASAKLDETHAPDSISYGLGWRYLLASIETDLSRFEFAD